jgi:hypothetical protein
MPSIPTWLLSTHGWLEIVSMTSYPSRLCSISKKSNAPPEQPVPRMFTSTTANPMRFARTAMPLCGPAGFAYPYPEYSINVGYGGRYGAPGTLGSWISDGRPG